MSDRDRKQHFRRGGGKGPDKGRESGRRLPRRDRDTGPDGPVILYGWHTVAAALANPQRHIRKLILTENAARRLADENIAIPLTPEIVRPALIDQRLGPDAVHQGLLAEADPLPSPDIDTLPQEGIVLVLDQITDPHNVGAIMRSAAAFVVKAIVTTARHSPEATGVLAKSASGALELVPLVTVQNLARALTENAARRLADENIDTRVTPEIVRPGLIDQRLGPDAVHQGLLAEADALPSPDIDALPQEGIVLVLDQITDPHNVGAIMRSAAAFGVKAIVTTARHSPEATGVLAKSASGALELVPLVTVQNLHRALTEMNDQGFMTVGLDSEGSENLGAVALRQPLALVLGAEGKGLRQLTRDTCSVVARLDMPGEIKSLNVSNAAVLALYIGASRLGLMG